MPRHRSARKRKAVRPLELLSDGETSADADLDSGSDEQSNSESAQPLRKDLRRLRPRVEAVTTAEDLAGLEDLDMAAPSQLAPQKASEERCVHAVHVIIISVNAIVSPRRCNHD